MGNQNLQLGPEFAHGRNILGKLKNQKYSRYHSLLQQSWTYYLEWQRNNLELKGTSFKIVKKRVEYLNQYKDYIDGISTRIFSAQSKFHSTVIEEFLYYLFKDEVERIAGERIRLGGIRAYSNIYFSPSNLQEFTRRAFIRVNEKDQDFAIYRSIKIQADGERKIINVPVVSIECKTYLDKTMLEGSIATAEKIKMGNPYCLFIVVVEYYDVSYEVDPKYSRIDQIYVLRKQKRRGEKRSPIDAKVVWDLFKIVKRHLEADWSGIERRIIETGKVL